jgi:hypothetical protein
MSTCTYPEFAVVPPCGPSTIVVLSLHMIREFPFKFSTTANYLPARWSSTLFLLWLGPSFGKGFRKPESNCQQFRVDNRSGG